MTTTEHRWMQAQKQLLEFRCGAVPVLSALVNSLLLFSGFSLLLSLLGACTSTAARTYVTTDTPDIVSTDVTMPSLRRSATTSPPTEALAGDVAVRSIVGNETLIDTITSERCGVPLLLTELMIDPAATVDELGEYIEIYNPTDEVVDLRNWTISDGRRGSTTIVGENEVAIHPNSFAVIAASENADENGDLEVVASLGKVSLSNNGGLIQVRDPCGGIVIRVRYGVRAPWPKKRPGVAIELKTPSADPQQPASWVAARGRCPSGDRGSPGFATWEKKSSQTPTKRL